MIAQKLTENSLFLFDESFAGTSGTEAEFIASEVITAFGIIGTRGIFATHLHGLSARVSELNTPATTSTIDTLSADSARPETEGESKRTYTIRRQPSDGLSHARDIAKRYGCPRRLSCGKNYVNRKGIVHFN